MIPGYGSYESYVARMKELDRAVAFGEGQINAFVSAARARGISDAEIVAFAGPSGSDPGDFARIESALRGERETITSGTTYVAPTTPQGGTLGGQVTFVQDPAPRRSDPQYQAALQVSTAVPSPSTSGPPSPIGYSTYVDEGERFAPSLPVVRNGAASAAALAPQQASVGLFGFDTTTLLILAAIGAGLWFAFRKR